MNQEVIDSMDQDFEYEFGFYPNEDIDTIENSNEDWAGLQDEWIHRIKQLRKAS